MQELTEKVESQWLKHGKRKTEACIYPEDSSFDWIQHAYSST